MVSPIPVCRQLFAVLDSENTATQVKGGLSDRINI
jgi:hypothetical protein